MLDLSPVKLLIIVVVVLILLGPDKLPQAARQIGAGWRKLRSLQEQLDSEVRKNIPDLPSTEQIAKYARSPLALLNQLADDHGVTRHGRDDTPEDDAATDGTLEHDAPGSRMDTSGTDASGQSESPVSNDEPLIARSTSIPGFDANPELN